MPEFGQRFNIEGQQGATFIVAAASASLERKNGSNWICDGAADDVDIQAAIDALPSGGGKVVLSEGTFTLAANIKLKSGTVLQGQGRTGYRIGTTPTGTVLVVGNSMDASAIVLNDADVVHFQIRDLSIDGNQANQASGDGIDINWTGSTLTNPPRMLIQNVLVHDVKQDGITIVQPSGMNGGAGSLIDVFAHQCQARGFDIGGADMLIEGCGATSNGTRGWQLRAGSSNTQIVNCFSKVSGQVTAANGEGFYITGGSRLQFSNCLAQDNTRVGFRVDTSDNMFSGCYADSNGYDTVNIQSSGWRINSDRQILVGCYAFDRNSGDDITQNYGFYIEGASRDDIFISGAHYNNVTAGLNNDNATPSNTNTDGLLTF